MRLALLLAAAVSLRAESGQFTIHLILHAIGEERYEITEVDGAPRLHTTIEYIDRGNKRSTTVDWKPGDKPKGATPFAVQMMMMRTAPGFGRAEGRDTIRVNGKPVELERFTVANLVFGREVLWMDKQRNLA